MLKQMSRYDVTVIQVVLYICALIVQWGVTSINHSPEKATSEARYETPTESLLALRAIRSCSDRGSRKSVMSLRPKTRTPIFGFKPHYRSADPTKTQWPLISRMLLMQKTLYLTMNQRYHCGPSFCTIRPFMRLSPLGTAPPVRERTCPSPYHYPNQIQLCMGTNQEPWEGTPG